MTRSDVLRDVLKCSIFRIVFERASDPHDVALAGVTFVLRSIELLQDIFIPWSSVEHGDDR